MSKSGNKDDGHREITALLSLIAGLSIGATGGLIAVAIRENPQWLVERQVVIELVGTVAVLLFTIVAIWQSRISARDQIESSREQTNEQIRQARQEVFQARADARREREQASRPRMRIELSGSPVKEGMPALWDPAPEAVSMSAAARSLNNDWGHQQIMWSSLTLKNFGPGNAYNLEFSWNPAQATWIVPALPQRPFALLSVLPPLPSLEQSNSLATTIWVAFIALWDAPDTIWLPLGTLTIWHRDERDVIYCSTATVEVLVAGRVTFELRLTELVMSRENLHLREYPM